MSHRRWTVHAVGVFQNDEIFLQLDGLVEFDRIIHA